MGTIEIDVSERASEVALRRRFVGFAAIVACLAACAFALAGAGTSFAAAPVTTAQIAPAAAPSGWHLTPANTSITVTLNAADTGTGVSAVRYRWTYDGLTPENWVTVGAAQAVATLPGLAGIHELEYYAVDDGNVEEDINSLEVKRDFSAPMLRLSSNPLVPNSIGGAWLPGAEFMTIAVDPPPISGSAVSPTTSEVDEASVEHRLAGSSAWVPGDAPITFNSVGTYTIEGRAADNAGNTVQGNLPPIVVENVTSGLKVGMKSSGKKKTNKRKKVVYKIQATNNYASPMNLQAKVCASVNKNAWADIEYRIPNLNALGQKDGWTKWAKGKCGTNYSLLSGDVFTPQFRVRPTKQAAKRAKKGQKTNIKVTFKTSVPAYGSRTQAITLKVKK